MFYPEDFKIMANKKVSTIEPFPRFSISITNKIANENVSKYSLAVAAKPFIHFLALFGSKFVRFENNNVRKVKLVSKIYALLIAVSYLVLATRIVRPRSWRDTSSDVPLNILTKTYGTMNICEAAYSFASVTIINNNYYYQLFKKLDNIDDAFGRSKTVFKRRRVISILLIILPIVMLFSTLMLRKFYIQNIVAYMTFFFLVLQGSVLLFFTLNIYIKLLMLNVVLKMKIKKTISKQKKSVFKETLCNSVIKWLCMEPKVMQINGRTCVWFQLMQIYDKLADCVHLFNEIYCGQLFIMFNGWLMCTLLVICRSLSPSIKYSEVVLSDLFLYSCISGRAILMAVMCEMFIRQRKKTLLMLLHILVTPGRDEAYLDQVKAMVMLVVSRKLEISANVFTVDVSTVMNFAGRIISYAVLMIQYFYIHSFRQ